MSKNANISGFPRRTRHLEDASSPGKLVWQLPLDQPVPGDNRVTESCQALPVVLLNCFRDQEICRGSFGTFVVGLPRSFRVQRLPAGSQRAQPSAARAPSLARRCSVNTLWGRAGVGDRRTNMTSCATEERTLVTKQPTSLLHEPQQVRRLQTLQTSASTRFPFQLRLVATSCAILRHWHLPTAPDVAAAPPRTKSKKQRTGKEGSRHFNRSQLHQSTKKKACAPSSSLLSSPAPLSLSPPPSSPRLPSRSARAPRWHRGEDPASWRDGG